MRFVNENEKTKKSKYLFKTKKSGFMEILFEFQLAKL